MFDRGWFVVNEVTSGVGGIVAALTVFIDINLEHIFGPVGVVLERGQAIDQASAAVVKEQARPDAGVRIAEEAEHLGPALNAIGVRRAKLEAVLSVLLRDGGAVVLSTEAIGPGDEPAEFFGIEPVALEHGADRGRVALGEPEAFGVFVEDAKVAVAVFAAEQDDREMGVSVVKRGEPFGGARVVEMVHDMNVAAEGREELAGRDIPVAMEPGPFLPAGEAFEDGPVFGIDETVVGDAGGDEDG